MRIISTRNPPVDQSLRRQLQLRRLWPKRLWLHLLLWLVGATFLFPWFWMITTSFKSKEQLLIWPPVWIPAPVVWGNYFDAFTKAGLLHYGTNTLMIAVIAVIGTVLSNTSVAYAFARMHWPGRDLVFIGVLATLMLPFHVRMIPLYLVFSNIGWINTYLPLTAPAFLGSAWFIFLLRQFFRNIPSEITDAARIDGCYEFGILWRIVIPIAKPAITVIALFQFISSWNEYLEPLIYLYDEELYTLALGLAGLRNTYGMSDFSVMMAASTLTTLPIVIIFFFAQQTFIQGITFSGLRG